MGTERAQRSHAHPVRGSWEKVNFDFMLRIVLRIWQILRQKER